MRARAVLLIKDAIHLKGEFERQSEVYPFVLDVVFTVNPQGIPNKGWFSAATDLIEALDVQAKEALALMNRVQEYQKGPEAICLRCSAIICLVTIAELYDRIFESKQDDRYSKTCLDTLGDVSTVTQGLQENEYYLLDPYVGVSKSADCAATSCVCVCTELNTGPILGLLERGGGIDAEAL